MIRSACRFSDSRVALSWMILDTMSCPCIGWTFLLPDRSSSVHTTQRICSPRAVWLVHLLDSVLRLSLVGENVQRRILHIDSSCGCPCVDSVVMSLAPGFWLPRPHCQCTLGCLTRYQYRIHRDRIGVPLGLPDRFESTG